MGEPETKNPLPLRGRARERGSITWLLRSRMLRRHASDAEKILWQHLRGRRMNGYKFNRQVVIEPYIVDFLCLEARLIIEADGGQHVENMEYDALRTQRLQKIGYRVMRFWNHEILCELPVVLEQIERALIETPSPQPSTPQGGTEVPEGEGVEGVDRGSGNCKDRPLPHKVGR